MATRALQAAIQQIDSNFADPKLSLQKLAAFSGLSVSHLCRQLKIPNGEGFRRRLHSARLDEARRLLLETSLSIKEIADRVGYCHSSHLARNFRQRFDVSPTVFRVRQQDRVLNHNCMLGNDRSRIQRRRRWFQSGRNDLRDWLGHASRQI
jgi:AraC-like DNA-binding protein